MIGQTISHYEILEKLGEVPKSLPTLCAGIATLRIPLSEAKAGGVRHDRPDDLTLSYSREAW